VDFSEDRDLFVNIFGFRGLTEKIRDCGLVSDKQRGLNEKWLEYLISELFSNRKCHGLGPWFVDQRRGGWSTGPPWISPVANGKSSPELGLAGTPGHGGSPRGWRWNGHNAARPGDHSPEPGRR
jgi:hypothetical protein